MDDKHMPRWSMALMTSIIGNFFRLIKNLNGNLFFRRVLNYLHCQSVKNTMEYIYSQTSSSNISLRLLLPKIILSNSVDEYVAKHKNEDENIAEFLFETLQSQNVSPPSVFMWKQLLALAALTGVLLTSIRLMFARYRIQELYATKGRSRVTRPKVGVLFIC